MALAGPPAGTGDEAPATAADAPAGGGLPGDRPPRRSGVAPIVGVIVLLAVLLCAGVVSTAAIVVRHGVPRAASFHAAGAAPPGAESAAPTPSIPDDGASVRGVKVGQCVRNTGTDDNPDLIVAPCGAGTYEVLANFPFTTDTSKCDSVAGSTTWYRYDHTYDFLDYVLCLRKR